MAQKKSTPQFQRCQYHFNLTHLEIQQFDLSGLPFIIVVEHHVVTPEVAVAEADETGLIFDGLKILTVKSQQYRKEK